MSNPQQHETIAFTLGTLAGAALKKTGVASLFAGVRSIVAPPDDNISLAPLAAAVMTAIPTFVAHLRELSLPSVRAVPAGAAAPPAPLGAPDGLPVLITFEIRPGPDGAYVATSPSLPDTSCHGPSVERALAGIGREVQQRLDVLVNTPFPPTAKTPPETSKPS